MYDAIFCSSLQLTAVLQLKLEITQPLQSSFDRDCACSVRLLGGWRDSRHRAPASNKLGPDSLSAARAETYSGLVTLERQPLPSAQSVQDSQTRSTR